MPRQGQPPGPVAMSFMKAADTIQAINGPVGGGKTTALFQKFSLINPMRQPPSPVDGVRRRVITIVHVDYRKLWRGPIPTWFKVWPKDHPGTKWTGGRNDPAEHLIKYRHPQDGGIVEVTARFIAIGDDDPEDVMRGYETSDWLLMEADLHGEETFKYALTRLARAPGREHGAVLEPAVACDFNAPEFDSWVHKNMLTVWKRGVRLWVQPPAAFESGRGVFQVNPNAENLHNLDPGYYPRQIAELSAIDVDLVRRFVCNEPGFSKVGLAVYAEQYSDHYHVAAHELAPEPALPLYIGVDAGGSPAAIIIQIRPGGAVWVFGEYIADPGTGPERFGLELREYLAQPRWHDFPLERMVAIPDPSAFFGGDQESDSLHDKDWVTKFRKAMGGIQCRTLPSNALFPRLQAVKDALTKAGPEPGLLLDPVHCLTVRKGFMQGYQYGKIKRANATGEYVPAQPVKNEYSHPHDALQYAILGARRYPMQGVLGAGVRRQRYASRAGQEAVYETARPRRAVR